MEHLKSATALTLAASIATGATAPAIANTLQTQHSEVQSPATHNDILSIPDPTLESSVVGMDGTVTNTRKVSVERPWAFDFSADPAAYEAPDKAEMHKFDVVLKTIKKNGEKGTELVVTPFASDEADTIAEDGTLTPGLGEENPENVELAETRGRTVGAAAELAVSNTLGQAIPTEYQPGNEVIDEVFAEKEAALAQELGMTPIQLAATYNHGGELPADTRAQLDRWIKDRRVDLKLVSTDQVPTISVPNEQVIIPPVVARTPDTISDVPSVYGNDSLKRREETLIQNGKGTPQATNFPRVERQIQPREYNMGKNTNVQRGGNDPRGKVSRNKGGNRS